MLEGSEEGLRLLVVSPCGWTDLGTPSRLRSCLASSRERAASARDAHAPAVPSLSALLGGADGAELPDAPPTPAAAAPRRAAAAPLRSETLQHT